MYLCVYSYLHLYLSHSKGEAVKRKSCRKKQNRKNNVFDGVTAEKFKIKEKKVV